VSARGHNGGRPFKMTAAKLRLARPANQCAARRLRSGQRKLTYSLAKAVKELNERAAERLNVFAVVWR
jgi:hypothetical protein